MIMVKLGSIVLNVKIKQGIVVGYLGDDYPTDDGINNILLILKVFKS